MLAVTEKCTDKKIIVATALNIISNGGSCYGQIQVYCNQCILSLSQGGCYSGAGKDTMKVTRIKELLLSLYPEETFEALL